MIMSTTAHAKHNKIDRPKTDRWMGHKSPLLIQIAETKKLTARKQTFHYLFHKK